MIILITATLSSKMYNKALWREKFGVRRDMINLSPTRFFRRGTFRFRSSFGMCLTHFFATRRPVPSHFLGEECNTSMTGSHRRAGIPSVRKPSVKSGRETCLLRRPQTIVSSTTLPESWSCSRGRFYQCPRKYIPTISSIFFGMNLSNSNRILSSRGHPVDASSWHHIPHGHP